MKYKDSHFWINDVANRLPNALVPKTKSWSALLSAITQLKTERNNAMIEAEELKMCAKRVDELTVQNAELLDALKLLLKDYRNSVGLEGAYDKSVINAEMLIKKVEIADEI